MKAFGAALGGAFALKGAGDGEAKFRCRSMGNACGKNADCCSGACLPTNRSGRRICGCSSAADCPAPDACHTASCAAGVCHVAAIQCPGPQDACHLAGACDPGAGCVNPPASTGTVCGASTCSSGQQTTQTCDGAGGCVSTTTDCGLFVCDSTSCKTTCASDSDCIGAAYCAGGQCVGDKAAGQACSGRDECLSGFSTDGVCCDVATCGDCQACNVAGSAGSCAANPAADGQSCASSPGGVCQSGSCGCASGQPPCNGQCLTAGQCCDDADCAATATDPCNEAYCDQTTHTCATRVNTNDTRCSSQANNCQTAYCTDQGQCIASVLCVPPPCKTTVGCSPQGECLYEDEACLPIDNCHTAACDSFGCTQTPKCSECQTCDPATGACSAGPDYDPATGANACNNGQGQCCQGSCASECCNGAACASGDVCAVDVVTNARGCCPFGQVLCQVNGVEQCQSQSVCCGGIAGQARCGDVCCSRTSVCCDDGTCCEGGCCGPVCCADGYQCCTQNGGSSYCIPDTGLCSPACNGQRCPNDKPYCCGDVCCSTECIVNRLGIFCFT